MESGGPCPKYKTHFLLVGSVFMLLPVSLDQYWGSVSPYALSYFVWRLSYTPQIQDPLTIPTFYAFWTVGFLLSGCLGRRFGPGRMVLAGSVISNVGVFSCYITVQASFWLFHVSVATAAGLGFGLIYGTSFYSIVNATEKHVGLFISLLTVATSTGAFVVTQLVTWYANPENESPSYRVGAMTYFTQSDVIDKVPSAFFVMGGFTLVSHVIGLSLLNWSFSSVDGALCQCIVTDKLSEDTALNELGKPSPDDDMPPGSLDGQRSTDYKPKEMLKTTTFYIIYFSFMVSEYGNLIIINYYKLFGQIWIHDDHFLSDIGTAMVIATAGLRAISGLALDTLGCKNCLLMLISVVLFMGIWFYVAAIVNPWLYFLVTVTYACFSGCLFTCYFATIALTFGKTHVTSNMSVVLMFNIVFNLVVPYVVEAILVHCGWFALFENVVVLHIANLLLCMLFLR